MTFFPPDQGSTPFDQFLAQFFGGYGPARRERSVDLTRLLSQPAPDLLVLAAEQAAASGRQHLDTEHLLWAATRIPTIADILQGAGIDAGDMGGRLEQGMTTGATATPVGLSPGAERALIDSHQIARELA
ncbi:Clp protease N-terminal domain-containing protein [Nocardia sp. NPDC024068]|uniref:Clp protease N-terminal domain-containing protein n=1 Tax=Nocardia sp. NPDC024068 TaxID=3157197 RepID=UPI00340DBF47